MVATAEREHAVVAPRLVDSEGRTSPSIRRAPTLRRGMSLAFTGLPAFTERVEVGPEYERAGPIDWATGAALLVPRRVPRRARRLGRVVLHVLGGDRLLPPCGDHGWRVWFEPDPSCGTPVRAPASATTSTRCRSSTACGCSDVVAAPYAGAAYWAMTLLREVGRGALGDRASRHAAAGSGDDLAAALPSWARATPGPSVEPCAPGLDPGQPPRGAVDPEEEERGRCVLRESSGRRRRRTPRRPRGSTRRATASGHADADRTSGGG